ncbi:MAG: lactate utilization protein [Syntrophomonas sp.]|nr:lactate utilization protein [Syntrophomonas sp.]
MAHDPVQWVYEQKCRKAVESLRKNGFEAVYCENRQEAYDYVIRAANDANTIGFGGSATIDTLQLRPELREMDKVLLQHNAPGLSADEKLIIRRRELTCDLFLTSSNAVTVGGQLVNIDGTGNRVGAMSFGPQKVIVVAGRNKITDNIEAALQRIKEYAAPANARRLNKKTPCAVTGFCSDCDSPESICRIKVILERKPSLSDITVLIVNEDMGY